MDTISQQDQDALEQLLITLGDCGGFMTDDDIAQLAKLDRLRLILVRCGRGRFLSPAQDVSHFIAAAIAIGDYVRDVSLPVSDKIFRPR